MYPEQTKLFAAIRSSHFARSALAATDIGFYGTSIAWAESPRIFGYFHYFARKLVSQDTRVCVYWVPSSKSMKIATTNPYSMNSNQGLSTGRYRAWNHEVYKLARSLQQNSSHKLILQGWLIENHIDWSSHPSKMNCRAPSILGQAVAGESKPGVRHTCSVSADSRRSG